MVNNKGIEIDLSKVKAICKLQPPTIVKEVQSLLERLNCVAQFIFQLSEMVEPLLLKKNAKVEWHIECQCAFE